MESQVSFTIVTQGEIGPFGLSSEGRRCFDADSITRLLGMIPHRKWNYGEERRGGKSRYLFSHWDVAYSTEGTDELIELDDCLQELLRDFSTKTRELKMINAQYDVNFIVSIQAHIEDERRCIFIIDPAFMQFCQEIGAKISVNIIPYYPET